jgi:hypothetical protein
MNHKSYFWIKIGNCLTIIKQNTLSSEKAKITDPNSGEITLNAGSLIFNFIQYLIIFK